MGFLEASPFLLFLVLEETAAFTFSIYKQNNIHWLLVNDLDPHDVFLLVLFTVLRGFEGFLPLFCHPCECWVSHQAVCAVLKTVAHLPKGLTAGAAKCCLVQKHTFLRLSALIAGLNFSVLLACFCTCDCYLLKRTLVRVLSEQVIFCSFFICCCWNDNRARSLVFFLRTHDYRF